ncbi:MAG: winged helix-turn-helix domain-containing protein [Candidatus Bathyarchaeota archaeon]|nr:winged helix-turn-helix domain-containing protein [Candidatus Bathyarchaeota archaeon]
MANTEEEIYSIMFTSLKHPVRRKILRMLNDKPLTFKEMVDHLEVSSSHLTYHLENLGELIYKMDNGKYKLSTFGLATVSAMKGVEEAPEIESKRRLKLPFKWRAVFSALMVAVLILAAMSSIQYYTLSQLTASQESLVSQNQELMSWGIGTSKIAHILRNVTLIDTTKYKITLLSNTMEYRNDFSVTEENLKYSLNSLESNLDVDFRFRANHFSRYELHMIESQPIFVLTPPSSVIENAEGILKRYKAYSGDAYLDGMLNLLTQVNNTQDQSIAKDNIKLQITNTGTNTVEFLWMYTENGVDFNAKSLRMTFQRNILIEMSDGYFLFTIANTKVNVNQEQAIQIARDYAKKLTWNIDGKQVTGFDTLETPVSVQFVPHPRGNSVALVPYWYIILRLDKFYSGGINAVSIGLYADTGEVVDVQMLSST